MRATSSASDIAAFDSATSKDCVGASCSIVDVPPPTPPFTVVETVDFGRNRRRVAGECGEERMVTSSCSGGDFFGRSVIL